MKPASQDRYKITINNRITGCSNNIAAAYPPCQYSTITCRKRKTRADWGRQEQDQVATHQALHWIALLAIAGQIDFFKRIGNILSFSWSVRQHQAHEHWTMLVRVAIFTEYCMCMLVRWKRVERSTRLANSRSWMAAAWRARDMMRTTTATEGWERRWIEKNPACR